MRQAFTIISLLWILQGCTTEGSQIQDVAVDEARLQLKTEMSKALDERMNGKAILI